MNTLVLYREDVRRIALTVGLDALMDEMIARLTEAFRRYDPDAVQTPARSGFTYRRPTPGLLEWMPSLDVGRQVTIKVVGYHPENGRRKTFPTIVSTISTYDTDTGHLRCLMDGTFATALRTGAASAVASRLLANARTETAGLIGLGAQAVTQLHAISRVLPIRRVCAYDVDPAAQVSFLERAKRVVPELETEIAPLETVVETADVLCTATSVDVHAGPVFNNLEPKPWCHVNAVGSDFPGKVELPFSLLTHSFVCPDFREQAMKEGECQQLTPEAIGPELYKVVQHPDRYLEMQDKLSVFDSTGWALEDQVASDMFMEYAADLKLGTEVPIEVISEDAVNPYDFVFADESAPVQRIGLTGS